MICRQKGRISDEAMCIMKYHDMNREALIERIEEARQTIEKL